MSTSHARREIWTARVVLVLLAALAWRIVVLVHEWRFGEFAHEALSALDGRASLPEFAGRLLGPLLLRSAIAVFGLAPDRAFGAVALVLLIVANLVAFESLRRVTGDRGAALRAAAASCVSFVLLADAGWRRPFLGASQSQPQSGSHAVHALTHRPPSQRAACGPQCGQASHLDWSSLHSASHPGGAAGIGHCAAK
jgi:hypothetical protein